MSVISRPTAAKRLHGRLPSGLRFRCAVLAVIAIWPFFFHAPLAFRVYHGGFQHVANDFYVLYYAYKPYLLAGLANGHIPLWMPQEAGGFPFALNPFTQALYPGNLLILPVARFLGHWGPLEQQWFALAAVSVLGLSLHLILRKIGVGVLPAALASIVVSSSYKVTETLRFPNATHAIACAAIAVLAIVYLRVTHRIAARAALSLLLAVSTFCLATAGYPYFFVYFFLLLPPLLLWIEFGSPGGYRAQRVGFGVFVATTLASIGVAVVAVSPYLIGMQEVLAQTTDRGGADWAYSTAHPFSGVAYVGSLVLPRKSSPEGWFYFGTAGIVVICLAFFVLRRNGGLRRYFRHIAAICVWIGWIMFFGLNASNPLFRLAWETLPVLDSMRVWPRINIFLVFPLAIVLGLSLEVVVRQYAGGRLINDEGRQGALFAMFVATGILGLQLAMALTQPADDEVAQNLVPYYYVPRDLEYILFTVVIAGLLACVVLVVSKWRMSVRRSLLRAQALCALLLVAWLWQIHGVQPWSWMWVGRPDPNNSPPADLPVGHVSFAQIAGKAAQSTRLGPTESPFFNPRAPWSTAVYPNWHFRRYVDFLNDRRVPSGPKNQLLGVTSRTRFFFVPGLPQRGALDKWAVDLEQPRAISIEYYDGSRVVADVESDTAGTLVFADNWDDGWTATVDGRPSDINVAFGTFKSVRVSPGRSRVEFSYCPFSAPVYRSLC